MRRSARSRPSWRLRQNVVYVLLGFVVLWNFLMIFHAIHPSPASDAATLLGSRGISPSFAKTNGRERTRPRRLDNVTAARHRRQPKDAPCVQIECIYRRAEAMARSFISAQNQTWRFPAPQTSNKAYGGLIYVKVPKTGSSTIAGATLRIARTHHVEARYDHSSGEEYGRQGRHPTHSFLFSSIRDPAERSLSFLAYEFSRTQHHKAMDLATLLESLRSMDRLGAVQKSEGRGGTQLAFTSLHSIHKHSAWKPSFPEHVVRADRVEQHASDVLKNYDFLLVTERMDESLVALAMLLRVSVRDVVVFSSKIAARNVPASAGENDHGSRQLVQAKVDQQFLAIHNKAGGMSCVPLRYIPTELLDDPQTQTFLQSDHWHAMNYGDYILHEAATRSLDKTIQDLGRANFQHNLAEYRSIVAKANEYCIGQVHGPCSSNGTLQLKVASENCYAGSTAVGTSVSIG